MLRKAAPCDIHFAPTRTMRDSSRSPTGDDTDDPNDRGRRTPRNRRCRNARAFCRADFSATRPPARDAQHMEAHRHAESRLLFRAIRPAVFRLRRAGPREKRHPDARDAWLLRHDGRGELYRIAICGAVHRHRRVRVPRRPIRPARDLHVVAALVHRRESRDGVPGHRHGASISGASWRASASVWNW